MEEFQSQIKKWVFYDDKIKNLNEEIKNIRNYRSRLTEEITDYVDNNPSLQDATIKISDGRLKFANLKQTTPITLSFLESCLNDLISDKESIKKIMDYIKSNRETKIVPDIKRYYNN